MREELKNKKMECAEKIAQVIAETLGCKTSSVSVAIKDIPEKDWKAEVWDKSIVPDEKYLYKHPGYSCEGS
ncbi:tautomerase family protein [Butyrivibrio sp. INlla16]|uniref:tautomerase family protein n=1 Tax=Butyrivibrio sp. INlla16 TaxID=1520807 RepID=UPI000AC4DE82|nr:tautomerase family protein [Butyrivibrio sp. INlla16]